MNKVERTLRLMGAWLIVAASAPVQAQVSCAVENYALDVFLTGGGANAIIGSFTPVLDRAPNSPVTLAVYCEGTGQFPPPVIAGATYAWNTGQSSQRIEVTAPGSDQTTLYQVTVNSPTGSAILSATLRGSDFGAPICTVSTNAPQSLTPGTTFTVTAVCNPPASIVTWDVRDFLGYMSILAGRDSPTALIQFNGAQPGQVMPIYLTPANALGQGPYASILMTAANPSASLPLNAAGVAGGGSHSCALTTAGGVKCWGDDTGGQLGDFRGAAFYSTTPVNVIGSATNIASISAGRRHMCALGRGGGVKCWGDNAYGQLGDGTRTSGYYQVDVLGLGSGVASIGTSATADHTCAVTAGGNAKCWGRNGFGQLGSATFADNAFPLDVLGLGTAVTAIATGSGHSCALTTAGGVKCWGRNSEGQLGDGTTTNRPTPVDVAGLSNNVLAVTTGEYHSCALMTGGAVKCWGWNQEGQVGANVAASVVPVPADVVLTNATSIAAGGNHTCALISGGLRCWGRNAEGQLGEGSFVDRRAPASVVGMGSGVTAVAGGAYHTCAIITGGGTVCWGMNGSGRLGDGTLASRSTAQLVLGSLGSGFLDLTLEDPIQLPGDKVPVFPIVASGSLTNVTANIQFRPADVGTVGNVYVFALAPASQVKDAYVAKDVATGLLARGTPEDAPVACVLAQLGASGQLQAVSASTMQAYVSGVLSAQGQAVTILNGMSVAQIGGATYYVGYGRDANAMFANGTNRSVVGASDPGAITCQPQRPQTGWWWNPLEGGRGYSLEVQGGHIFFAAFHYDVSGRATWNVATGSTSLDGSMFVGDLLEVAGGQTLGGAYPGFPRVSTRGPITLAFSDASHGAMIWPGGTVPIERFNIVQQGLDSPPLPNQPEGGWWWNPQESGRGFFIEWQKGFADIAGYMYDDAGNPIWYIAVYESSDLRQLSGNWWQYANGQSMLGAWKPADQINNHIAPFTLQFSGPDSAVLTLPNGRTTALVRQRF